MPLPQLTYSQPQTQACGEGGANVDGETCGRDAGPENCKERVIQYDNSLQDMP